MADPLAPLLADGVIDEVVARLKSGKEADLWLVRHGGEIVAAKVYKAREARSFRNNAAYKEGRTVRDTRTQRAMARGSRFGQAAAEEAWKAKEAEALHTLHAAGVRVPSPVMFYEGVLLMEVVLDASGHPAPRLIDAHLPRESAAPLYADLRGQAVRMLCCDLIHGDLSAYNVLLGAGGPVIIDFPQVIGAAHNSQAQGFFQRDLHNLRRFFAAIDPSLDAASGDGAAIWRAYARRELSPDFVPSGRAAPPRALHEQRRHPAHGTTPAARSAAPPARQGAGASQGRHGAGAASESHARHAAPPADAHHPRHGSPPGGLPARRGRGGRHRPEPAGPEVIRVTRPATPASAPTSRAPAPVTPGEPAPAPGGGHGRTGGRRRRRRRRSSHGQGPPR